MLPFAAMVGIVDEDEVVGVVGVVGVFRVDAVVDQVELVMDG